MKLFKTNGIEISRKCVVWATPILDSSITQHFPEVELSTNLIKKSQSQSALPDQLETSLLNNMNMENIYWDNLQAFTCSVYSKVLLDLSQSWIVYFCISLNAVFIVTAIVGNLLILVALQKDSRLHPPSKLLFRCLASTDLFVGLISQPCFVIYLISVVRKNEFGICEQIIIFLQISTSILCGISLCTLTAISVDRLLALLLGLRYKQVVTLVRVRRFTFLQWIVFSSLSMLYFWNARIFLTTLSFNVVLFLVACTICYSKICFTLRLREAQVREQSVPGQVNMCNRAHVLKYKRTVSTSLWVSMSMIACYLPFCVVAAVMVVQQDIYLSVFAEEITASLIYLNSSLNPLIYCWRIREVRQAVKTTIRRFCLFCF